MHYIPCTDSQEKELLAEIGISNFEELIDIIPSNLRFNDKIGVGEPLSEIEIERASKELISNKIVMYDHNADKKDINKWTAKKKLLKLKIDQLPTYISSNTHAFNDWLD